LHRNRLERHYRGQARVNQRLDRHDAVVVVQMHVAERRPKEEVESRGLDAQLKLLRFGE
jgi:hypothetical protein